MSVRGNAARVAAISVIVAVIVAIGAAARAQQPEMPGMKMSAPATLIQTELAHTDSGTSIEPASTPMSMVMAQRKAWMLMLHGSAFVSDAQQQAGNERGHDKLFSTNWIMPMAMRPLGPGQLTVRAMFSLEPATVTGRFYPELFQQGETAYGKPIVDGQHPHNFFMELGAAYDARIGERTLLSFYAAPIGDPALGPAAYPHRESAAEDPIAPLGHHQEDSTHVAFSVLTAGATYRWVRLEGSGFHGAEPDESRWTFAGSHNGHAIDSYAGRITVSPAANWTGQYSIGRLASPEAGHLGDDQIRQTASAMYTRTFGAKQAMPGMAMKGDHGPTGYWSNTVLWGHTHSLATNANEDSYLVESLLHFGARNNVWTRMESAERTSELVDRATDHPLGHVEAVSIGYDREFRVGRHVSAAPGAQFTQYRAPDALVSTYGRSPYGAVGFVRFRVRQ